MENRLQLPLSKRASGITIIDKKLIERSSAGSIAELISLSTGVDIRSRGVNGIQSDAGIRGSSFDQVVILINGIKMSDPQTGHHSMNLPIDISAIEQIEIIKGPSARVYGENSFAGAINIVTKIPESTRLTSGFNAGQFGMMGASGSLSFGNIDFRNYLSISHNRSDGYRYNTDYQISNLFWQSNIFTNAGDIDITFGYSRRDFGANGFYASPDYRDQYEEVKTGLIALGFSPRINSSSIKIKGRLYWRHNKDEYLFIRNDPDYYRNLHTSDVAGFDLNLSYKNSLGITGIGYDMGVATISSTRLGSHNRGIITLFAEHSFFQSESRLIVTPGVHFSYYSDFGLNLLPGIDIGYRIGNNKTIYVSSGYTFRIPTYTDLYYEDPINSSNPELKPEYAFSNELGIRDRGSNGVSYQVNLFNRRTTNLIDRVKSDIDDKWTPENITRANISGIETEFSFYPQKITKLERFPIALFTAGYTYLHAEIVDRSSLISRFEFDNLRHHFVSTISIDLPGNIYQQITFRYYNRVTLGDYSLFDTRVGFRNKNLDLYLNISNGFNTQYSETNLVKMPGRWISIGFNYSITR
jgi:iron complex outermembrane receptor protein